MKFKCPPGEYMVHTGITAEVSDVIRDTFHPEAKVELLCTEFTGLLGVTFTFRVSYDDS